MGKWQRRLNLMGCGLLGGSAMATKYFVNNWTTGYIVNAILSGLTSLVLLLLSLACFHAASMNPAKSHSIRSIASAYTIYYIIMPLLGKPAYHKMLKIMDKPQKYQDDLLMAILKQNSATRFSKDHGLDKIKSREEFIEKFPLTDYSAYEKYVERIAAGEDNVMTKAKVKYLCVSSGTTGKNKMFPYTFSDYSSFINSALAFVHTLGKVTHSLGLQRKLHFRLFHPSRQSEAGIPIGGLGMALDKHMANEVVPDITRKITQEGPSYFVQALFGLRDPEVGIIQGYSSDLMYSFLKSMESNCDKLCKAIAEGYIESFPGLDDEVRRELNELLTPDVNRAAEVRQQIIRGSDNLANRLWPSVKNVLMARTGGFAHCAELLQNSYFKNLTIGFGSHAGTEGFFGFSMDPESFSKEEYTFIPTNVFLEFIEIGDIEKDNPRTYLLDQIKIGELYEILVTNYHGLYRNRFGDVIKVVGFKGKTPTYTFQYRTGQILNCAFDRTPEKVFYEAVKLTESKWGNAKIKNYTSTESFHIEAITGKKYEKNHYITFIETEGEVKLTDSQCELLEKNLMNCHEPYAEFRAQNSVGPVKIIQVVPGTFDDFRQVMWGANPNMQFKTPRVMRRPDVLTFLWENRLQEYS